jgi:hypothetical protein
MSSWIDPRLGWRLLKEIKKKNRLYHLKTEKPSFIPRPKPVTPTIPSAPLKIQ